MNIIFLSILFFIAVFLFLSWFARQKTKKIAKGVRNLIVILSLLIAIIFAIGNKLLLSLPLFFLAVSALKIKGLGALQILMLFRMLNYYAALVDILILTKIIKQDLQAICRLMKLIKF